MSPTVSLDATVSVRMLTKSIKTLGGTLQVLSKDQFEVRGISRAPIRVKRDPTQPDQIRLDDIRNKRLRHAAELVAAASTKSQPAGPVAATSEPSGRFPVTIDPGNASEPEIEKLISILMDIDRAAGGIGISPRVVESKSAATPSESASPTRAGRDPGTPVVVHP